MTDEGQLAPATTFSHSISLHPLPTDATCSTAWAGGKPYCDLANPFQDADRHFYDKPTGVYPIDSFRGIALLSNVDSTNKVLTVYDTGLNYGFDLFVIPEPGTFVPICAGLGLLFVLRRRALLIPTVGPRRASPAL